MTICFTCTLIMIMIVQLHTATLSKVWLSPTCADSFRRCLGPETLRYNMGSVIECLTCVCAREFRITADVMLDACFASQVAALALTDRWRSRLSRFRNRHDVIDTRVHTFDYAHVYCLSRLWHVQFAE